MPCNAMYITNQLFNPFFFFFLLYYSIPKTIFGLPTFGVICLTKGIAIFLCVLIIFLIFKYAAKVPVNAAFCVWFIFNSCMEKEIYLNTLQLNMLSRGLGHPLSIVLFATFIYISL